MYLTKNPAEAQKYADGIKGVPSHGAVRPYTVRVSNTLDVRNDPKARDWALQRLLATGDYDWLTADEPRFKVGYHIFFEKKWFIDAARKAGYDSMIVSEYPDGREETLAVFDSSAITPITTARVTEADYRAAATMARDVLRKNSKRIAEYEASSQ